jgi:5-enolpyruvylshikimate-3-phosphate synthase
VTLQAPTQLQALNITIPGDFSSAAFFIVAASIIPGSSIVLNHVGINPTRTGLIPILQAMGADIHVHPNIDDYTQRISSCDKAPEGGGEGVYTQYMTDPASRWATQLRLDKMAGKPFCPLL